MVDVNKLRINNIVHIIDNCLSKCFKIYKITDQSSYLCVDSNGNEYPWYIEEYEIDYIGLSSEILLNKCIFILYEHDVYKRTVYFDVGVYRLLINIDRIFISHYKCEFKDRSVIGDKVRGNFNIKYLHQLQNLYFYLTGKELAINL